MCKIKLLKVNLINDMIQMSFLNFSMKKREEQFGGTLRELSEVPVDIKKRFGKPMVMVLPVEATGADDVEIEGARRNICDYYLGEGIPVFLTLERAVKALANLVGYWEHRDAILSPE